jgi:hypothetical protein
MGIRISTMYYRVTDFGTRIVPAVRLAEEQSRLRPLRVKPEDLALRIPVYVGPTGYVVHDTHPYSMPPDALGLPGTLYLYRDRVRIVVGRYQAEHKRKFGPPTSRVRMQSSGPIDVPMPIGNDRDRAAGLRSVSSQWVRPLPSTRSPSAGSASTTPGTP